MIYTRYMEHLPPSVYGFVVRDSNDDYTIVINPSQAHNQQMKAAKHELEHIKHDFGREISVTEIEALRHKK